MFIIPALPSILIGNYRQGLRYILSGHILQSILIVPLLYFFPVQEIWWIKHLPDGLNRIFNSDFEALRITYNCFPSMHTSIAVASIIVTLKEKKSILRGVWITYCILIIFSTVFFPIHWLLDLIAGIIFGYFCVLVSDWIIKIYCK